MGQIAEGLKAAQILLVCQNHQLDLVIAVQEHQPGQQHLQKGHVLLPVAADGHQPVLHQGEHDGGILQEEGLFRQGVHLVLQLVLLDAEFFGFIFPLGQHGQASVADAELQKVIVDFFAFPEPLPAVQDLQDLGKIRIGPGEHVQLPILLGPDLLLFFLQVFPVFLLPAVLIVLPVLLGVTVGQQREDHGGEGHGNIAAHNGAAAHHGGAAHAQQQRNVAAAQLHGGHLDLDGFDHQGQPVPGLSLEQLLGVRPDGGARKLRVRLLADPPQAGGSDAHPVVPVVEGDEAHPHQDAQAHDVDHVAQSHRGLFHHFPVEIHAVAAVQIPNDPGSAVPVEGGMLPGDQAVGIADITVLASADPNGIALFDVEVVEHIALFIFRLGIEHENAVSEANVEKRPVRELHGGTDAPLHGIAAHPHLIGEEERAAAKHGTPAAVLSPQLQQRGVGGIQAGLEAVHAFCLGRKPQRLHAAPGGHQRNAHGKTVIAAGRGILSCRLVHIRLLR